MSLQNETKIKKIKRIINGHNLQKSDEKNGWYIEVTILQTSL